MYIHNLLSVAGIDKILAKSLTREIKNNLDDESLRKLERTLFLENGMSIKLSMEHFATFHSKLKKILTVDICKFEKKCLDSICKIRESKDKIKLKIIDKALKQKILEYYGDSEAREILSSVMSEELAIPDILKISKVPKTSGYRKIENLILDGLLVESGKALSKSKKVSKYKCIFENIEVEIKNKIFVIDCVPSRKEYEKSTIMKVINKV